MLTKNLDKIKQQILYFVENDMIDSNAYKLMLRQNIYDEEDVTAEKNLNELYGAMHFLNQNKAVADEVQKNLLIIAMINYLMSPKLNKATKQFAIKSARNAKAIKRVRPKKIDFHVIDGDGKLIKVAMLSKSMPSLTKEIIERLESGGQRTGFCHYDSMQLIRWLLNDDAKVVTGNVAYYFEGDSYSHSWIEYKSQKQHNDMVLDFTMNAIMPKEDYYRLRKPEVLSVVTREQIKEAIEELNLFDEGAPLHNIDNKVLLLFFDELIEVSKEKLKAKQNFEANSMQKE